MIIGICIGFVVGVLTMVIAFIVGERFRVMEVADKKEKKEITARYKKWHEGTLTGRDFSTFSTLDEARKKPGSRRVRTKRTLDEIAQLTADIAEARQMNEDFLSGHFCPNPQLSKLASTCDCAHSDRHRKMDWETIDGLTKVLEKIAKNKDATEYYDEIITGGFTQMPDIAKHLVNQIGREADDALQRKKPESRRPNGTIVNSQ